MRRGTEIIQDHSLCNGGKPSFGINDPNSDRLASLASMTLARQTPGLVLPLLTDVPCSYSHTKGTDISLTLARSLVELGLGTSEMWERHNANPSLFIRSALNEWLQSIGVSQLKGCVEIDLAIVETFEEGWQKKGSLFILLETNDGCGFMTVGSALNLLENEQPGLGRAFYIVLILTMNVWMDVYDQKNAVWHLEQLKESIEGEIEDPETPFEDYCRDHGLHLPDLEAATPPCARDIPFHKERRRFWRSIALLKGHRNGKYAAWIEPVLKMASLRQSERAMDPGDVADMWDSGPLPNWVVAFKVYDPISQAFDEESQHMNESSHCPSWIDSFDPSNVKDVMRVLNHVQRFVMVNQLAVTLKKLFEEGSENDGSPDSTEVDDELRAA